jgi:hypothetical protein
VFARTLSIAILATLSASASSCSVVVLAGRSIASRFARREILVDQIVRGDTRQPDGRFAPRCASHPGSAVSDQAWEFTATQTRTYVAHVRAMHDATVSVYEGTSDSAREIACDDDGAALAEPRLSFSARAGHTYSIVVDGYRAERGPYELVLSR